MKDGRRNMHGTTHPGHGCRRRLSLWFKQKDFLRLRGAAA
jgi:hypothetical protein